MGLALGWLAIHQDGSNGREKKGTNRKKKQTKGKECGRKMKQY